MTIHAMICGINYYNTPNELRGCINDMLDMRSLLLKSGVEQKNLTILSDDPKRQDIYPSRENILKQLKIVANSVRSGDTLVFHYSGHGTYSRDTNNDEADKRDEAICPADDTTITDDELYGILRKLPKDIKAFVMMDCCHSGSILDLANGLDKKESKRPDNNNHGYVVEISGCQDNQTSADALLGDKSKVAHKKVNKREFAQEVKRSGTPELRYRGALTAAFMNVVEKRYGLQAIFDICFSGSRALMLNLRADILGFLKKNHFTQVPNIAYEGVRPVTLAVSREPILHAFSSGRYNLRPTKARLDREYIESAEFEKQGLHAKLR